MKRSLKGKRILITGGCGFIGSHLVRSCLFGGARVEVLSSKDDSCWRLDDVGSKVKIRKVVYTNQKSVSNALNRSKPHYVFHLASRISRERSFDELRELKEIHFDSTLTLIEGLKKTKGLIRFVHVGTIDEYGGNSAPFQESARELPTNPYAFTKLVGTRLVELLAKNFGFPAVIIRPALVYGPAQNLRTFIPSLIRACLDKKPFPMTRGEQTRDFLFVEDLVRGLLLVAVLPGVEGEIINMGSGKETNLKEVALVVNSFLGSPAILQFGAQEYRSDEHMHFWLDSSKAKKLLGWKSRISLREGILKTCEWYKNN